MKHIRPNNQGIIGLIIIIVVALIILGYFGFDVRKIVESPQVQKNLGYVWGIITSVAGWIWDAIMFLAFKVVGFFKELKS